MADDSNPTGEERRLRCRLSWDGGRATLPPGSHVLGRDHEADVVIDSTTISRRHARLTVSERDLTLEDLESRNGTWVEGSKVEGTVHLEDGGVFRLGTVDVTLRLTRLDDPTGASKTVGQES